ncbi:sodium:proton antiporter [Tuwongella immobilis]|uniref:Citrate transporter-like domain-containing protein n=1 Tax=Tuwongella immobilis TaxID=692036 RepID=A0A6C2YJW2_9BACT|nr:sodium:proton antiporter [Tuwongella immobilis]VIP01393.1 Uncharacterized protein OS=uncultured bacterium GN=ACD_62C00483G0002 PE=4 SV=1 [Tuwongella immobilis]VTR98272.1 Uncharacterized protein OS=uncultured bacterium GN=ACD_62C00483G0002 PE=4 SV=1 [Tuwongella immobilis]
MTGMGIWGAVEAAHAWQVTPVAAMPFVLMLLGIAVLPLVAEHWWHSNRNKGIVSVLLGLPIVVYLLAHGEAGSHRLMHAVEEYAAFILLLLALYTISGGILLTGDLPAHPRTNVMFLGLGAVLANFVGTTGASMLLIRPLLRTNSERNRKAHVPLFFIFVVSNLGGLLTPLGDPPLFLGFLKGVSFFWTLSLWPQWLVANGIVLAVFYVWDSLAYRNETVRDRYKDERMVEPLKLHGAILNGVLLLGVLLVVIFQSPQVGEAFGKLVGGGNLMIPKPFGEVAMASLTLLSVLFTAKDVRQRNQFTWGPIVEVAVLFVGIFVTMVPALMLLEANRETLGVTQPWQYFWLTGSLSAFLDNAPTYVTFATLASGGEGFGQLAVTAPTILAAVSCGAVFMGAMTYIGNGPNLMVKAISDEMGYRMPSFFGYLLRSVLVLGPVMGLITVIFFRG